MRFSFVLRAIRSMCPAFQLDNNCAAKSTATVCVDVKTIDVVVATEVTEIQSSAHQEPQPIKSEKALENDKEASTPEEEVAPEEASKPSKIGKWAAVKLAVQGTIQALKTKKAKAATQDHPPRVKRLSKKERAKLERAQLVAAQVAQGVQIRYLLLELRKRVLEVDIPTDLFDKRMSGSFQLKMRHHFAHSDDHTIQTVLWKSDFHDVAALLLHLLRTYPGRLFSPMMVRYLEGEKRLGKKLVAAGLGMEHISMMGEVIDFFKYIGYGR